MTTINCSSNCIYQKDGQCSYESIVKNKSNDKNIFKFEIGSDLSTLNKKNNTPIQMKKNETAISDCAYYIPNNTIVD